MNRYKRREEARRRGGKSGIIAACPAGTTPMRARVGDVAAMILHGVQTHYTVRP